LWLQKLTTRVPDDAQIEVAISSLVVALDDEMLEAVRGRGGVPETALQARREVLGSAPSSGGE
jgi:hypothetical protein